MSTFDLDAELDLVGNYDPSVKLRARTAIQQHIRRLDGLLAASQARDEMAQELLREEVRRSVQAEAEAERLLAERDRLVTEVAALTPWPDDPVSPISGSEADRAE